MRSFYDFFNAVRDSFVKESERTIYNTNSLEERILSMAADLTSLTREVARVVEAQEKASIMIGDLVRNVSEITTLLQNKTIEAESAVDINLINSLVEKLKVSTDGLSNIIDSNKRP